MLEKPPGASVAEVLDLEQRAQARRHVVVRVLALACGRGASSPRAQWLGRDAFWRCARPGRRTFACGIRGRSGFSKPAARACSIPGSTACRFSRASYRAHARGAATLLRAEQSLSADRRDASLALRGHDAGRRRVRFPVRAANRAGTSRSVTDAGTLLLSHGGQRLHSRRQGAARGRDREYARLYAQFAALIAARESEVDVLPLQHVADAFLLAQWRTAPAFRVLTMHPLSANRESARYVARRLGHDSPATVPHRGRRGRRNSRGSGHPAACRSRRLASAHHSASWLAQAQSAHRCLSRGHGRFAQWPARSALCPLPADSRHVVARVLEHEHSRRDRVTIAGGLCSSPGDRAGDVMRGEEAQIFGALRLDPTLAQRTHILVLPGTHSKWVELEDGKSAFSHRIHGRNLRAAARPFDLLACSATVRTRPTIAAGLRRRRTARSGTHRRPAGCACSRRESQQLLADDLAPGRRAFCPGC